MAAGDAINTDAAFRPHVLREYALLADGERGALVGPHGDITWMCAPCWDSDAVLSALIGGGGTYAVTPVGQRHVWGGYYEPGSLIWHSRWITSDGVIECREALAFPGDPGRVIVLRRVLAVRGAARIRVLYFQRNRAACGPPGLFSEEYAVTQRQLRGNLPQAFVHALLLECASRLTSDVLTPD
ncbi:MAG TPA: trehalase-like domain-containing protein [Streptosporangiaceae bacterium]|jgi:hypothetical protein|nr:trehalase-like domain-containing protein [Streptosporangiaceae bacterium]